MCLIATERNKCFSPETGVFVVFFLIFTWLPFVLAENLLGYIDWIPQRLELQFSASHGGSLPGTTGYIHEAAYALSVSNTATERQTANGISEGTIFRKGSSSIYQRFNFLIASSISISKLIERNISVFLCFCLVFHIHFAIICVVRSYRRPSYLLHGFRVVRRLAFYVRDQWSLFSSEVHAKLTRLVSAFVETNMFRLVVFLCTLQFEDSKVHGGCKPILIFLVLKNMPF